MTFKNKLKLKPYNFHLNNLKINHMIIKTPLIENKIFLNLLVACSFNLMITSFQNIKFHLFLVIFVVYLNWLLYQIIYRNNYKNLK